MTYPTKVEQFDFNSLTNYQCKALADFMGCRHQLNNLRKDYDGQRAFLKQHCLNNVARAQTGYDVIIRKQTSPTAQQALPQDVERRMYEVLTDCITQHKDSLGDQAGQLVAKAAGQIKSQLETYAKEQIKLAAQSARPIVIKERGKTRTVKGTLPAEFERMVQLGGARKNIMLVGPAGCGKTYLAAKLAEALDLPFADQSCSAGLSESAFTGWLLPTGKSGTFEYVESPFIKLYENGGVFLFDEMDAADANLLTFLNKALANDCFFLPQRFNKPLVKRHPDFVAIGAANTYGHGADAMYVGRNQLDAATLDRFRVGMITMDYSTTVEEALAPKELLEWAWGVRKAIREKSLRRVMSTRTIKDMADMAAHADWKKPDWEGAYFTDWSAEELALVRAGGV